MIAPVPLAAPATVHIDDNLMVAKLQPGDLHAIASTDGRAVRGNGTIELLDLQRLAHGDMETFLARWQRLDGSGKFTGNIANQIKL